MHNRYLSLFLGLTFVAFSALLLFGSNAKTPVPTTELTTRQVDLRPNGGKKPDLLITSDGKLIGVEGDTSKDWLDIHQDCYQTQISDFQPYGNAIALWDNGCNSKPTELALAHYPLGTTESILSISTRDDSTIENVFWAPDGTKLAVVLTRPVPSTGFFARQISILHELALYDGTSLRQLAALPLANEVTAAGWTAAGIRISDKERQLTIDPITGKVNQAIPLLLNSNISNYSAGGIETDGYYLQMLDKASSTDPNVIRHIILPADAYVRDQQITPDGIVYLLNQKKTIYTAKPNFSDIPWRIQSEVQVNQIWRWQEGTDPKLLAEYQPDVPIEKIYWRSQPDQLFAIENTSDSWLVDRINLTNGDRHTVYTSHEPVSFSSLSGK